MIEQVIQSVNTRLKLFITQALGKNNMNVLLLSTLHSVDVKVLCGIANETSIHS